MKEAKEEKWKRESGYDIKGTWNRAECDDLQGWWRRCIKAAFSGYGNDTGSGDNCCEVCTYGGKRMAAAVRGRVTPTMVSIDDLAVLAIDRALEDGACGLRS